MALRPILLLTGLALLVFGPPAQAHPIANWTETAARIAAEEAKTPGPPDSRLRAQVALAMFEAVNATQPKYASYLGLEALPAPAAAAELAAARAAHDVLVAKFPTRAGALQDALELARAAVPEAAMQKQGEAAGRAAAAAVLARRAFHPGEDAPYVPAAAPGRYIGTDLPGLPPRAVLARPYFLATSRDVAPPPPPALTSQRYGRDLEEVRRLGGKAGSSRTTAQTANGAFWARQDILAPLRDLTTARPRPLVDTARTYARIAMALDDASNAVSAAKLDHGFWRPVTAIRNADADANPRTIVDRGWEPLMRTPPHPEYPCGHCIVAATFASLVEAEFGADARLHVHDAALPAASRTLTPKQMVEEISFSRVLAGAHFRFSAEAGEAMGRAIAARALTAMAPLGAG